MGGVAGRQGRDIQVDCIRVMHVLHLLLAERQPSVLVVRQGNSTTISSGLMMLQQACAWPRSAASQSTCKVDCVVVRLY